MKLQRFRNRSYLPAIAWPRCIAVGLATLVIAGPAASQDTSTPAWLDVAIARVKPEQQPAFEDLIKEYLNARSAAGLPASTVYQVQIGHPNEYHVVTPIQSIAANAAAPEPMSDAEYALWLHRIQATIESVRFFDASLMPDFGVDGPSDAPFLLLRTIRVVSGEEAEYERWVADQYLPAFRQTEGMGHTMSRGVYGDSPQNYYHAYAFSDLAVLDVPDPLIAILGQRRYDQVFDAIDNIVESHEMVVARRRPDLMAD
jgi:hypothetical protein